MKYTYVPLPLVEEAKSVTASAQVLVIDDGEVKRTDAANIGIKPTGKIIISENGTDIDVSQYATADVAVSGGSSGIPAPTITVTFVISDYSNIALLETGIVEEIEGSYQQITLTEVTQETTVITGIVLPVGYADYSIHWTLYSFCSDGDDPYNVSISDTVNCVADDGAIEVTDITQPCSATFTFTKGS